MRSRSIRISITIILILGIAIAALGFKNINIDIPGFPELDRDGSGPLGLKLGLDLRGGGHLVFQADTGTRFDITFTEDVSPSDLNTTLEELRFGEDDLALEDIQVIPLNPNRFQIRTGLLAEDDPRRTELDQALADAIGAIRTFQVRVIEAPTSDQMKGVLDNITRHVRMGKSRAQVALDGTREVALPVLVSTITFIVVFFPVVFLTGMARYLFQPLAITVVFAVVASYIVAMFVIPSFCAKFIKVPSSGAAAGSESSGVQPREKKREQVVQQMVDVVGGVDVERAVQQQVQGIKRSGLAFGDEWISVSGAVVPQGEIAGFELFCVEYFLGEVVGVNVAANTPTTLPKGPPKQKR